MQDSHNSRLTYLADAGALVVALALFLSLAFYQIDLPGLYNDEAMDVVPAMQMLQGQPIDLSRGAGITIGDRTYPIMTSDYQGVVSTYLAIPFFASFGVSVFAIRAMSISFGVASIILTYFVGRALFNRTAGVAAALMLAVMPSFVFWSRIGLYVVNEVVPIGLASLLCLIAWRRKGSWGYLGAAAFLLGLGLSTKLLFLWFVTSLVAAAVLLNWRRIASTIIGYRTAMTEKGSRMVAFGGLRMAKVGLLSVGGLALGALPFLVYNLQTRGTYLVLRANLASTPHGVNNFDFLNNLRVEADAFRVLLDGGYFWFLGGVFSNPVAPWVFAGLAAILGALIVLRLVDPGFAKGGVFVALMLALIFIQSCFTVSGLWATHLLIALPFPQLLAGAALSGVIGWLRRSPALPSIATLGLASLLILGLVGLDLKTDVDYHSALSRSGGYTTFSDGIYGLADYLDQNGVLSPLAVDWGFKSSVQILTQGRVNPREVYGMTKAPDEEFRQRISSLIRDQANVYIFHSGESTAYRGRLAVLRDVASQAGLKVVLQKAIYHRDGKPLFRIYRVAPRQ